MQFDVYISQTRIIRVEANGKEEAYEKAHNTDDHISEHVENEQTLQIDKVQE